MNFVRAPTKIPTSHIITAVEKGLSKLPTEEAASVRRRVISVLSRAKPPPSNLSPEFQGALRSLRKKDDLLILPADKGRATVVLDKGDYDRKINGMLSDEKTYGDLTVIQLHLWRGN